MSGPLTYNSGTGLFGINIANSTTTGALSATDWNTFNNKIGSINGLTGVTQTFAVGTAGTDFNIVSSGGVHTFNLPDASVIARGLMSTGAQSIAGIKTWTGAQYWDEGGFVGTGKFITFTNPGVGNVPGGFHFGLTNDTASLYAIENTADNSDYVFKLGDNAADGGDRYVFWQTAWQGAAQDRWPLVMNGSFAAFNPRFTGNTATGTMTQATMYMNYTTNNIGIGTLTPTAKLDIQDHANATGTILSIASTGMTASGKLLQITGSG